MICQKDAAPPRCIPLHRLCDECLRHIFRRLTLARRSLPQIRLHLRRKIKYGGHETNLTAFRATTLPYKWMPWSFTQAAMPASKARNASSIVS